MTMVERIISDLRERRLWPLAAALLVAIVAVPIVLAKTPAQAPPPPPVPVAAATPVRTSLPSVSVATTRARSALHAKPYNPFTPPKAAKAANPVARVATAGPTTNSGVVKSSSGSSSQSGASSSGSGGATTPPPATGVPVTHVKIPAAHAKPAPAGLRPDQTYDVTFAATRTDGGLDTVSSLERLSAVPRATAPLLVELGVLQGGRRVLFAVLPGSGIAGPGSCIPGPVDCEVLSLGVNQVEAVWNPDHSVAAEFAVSAIGVHTYRSRAAAQKARTATSAQGRALLAAAKLIAPDSIFSYDASLGAVVDLRNLAGGN